MIVVLGYGFMTTLKGLLQFDAANKLHDGLLREFKILRHVIGG